MHDSIVLLRRIHGNLYVGGSSSSAWRRLRIHNPFWLVLVQELMSKLVD